MMMTRLSNILAPLPNSYQFLWRPRPPSLLTPAKEQHIQSNLDTYIASLRESDAKAAEAVKIADREKRLAIRNELNNAIEAARQRYNAAQKKRVEVFGFDPDAASPDLVRYERTKEVLLDTKEEIVLELE